MEKGCLFVVDIPYPKPRAQDPPFFEWSLATFNNPTWIWNIRQVDDIYPPGLLRTGPFSRSNAAATMIMGCPSHVAACCHATLLVRGRTPSRVVR
jgi:hypothetical protein